jgi:DNA mismatch repair protein MutL
MATEKIKILDGEVINRIAAGEVVERPASVVKELIENAIDAGATKIEVEIKEGGQKSIEITDNGEGMSPNDALLAFMPHATSKISTDEDLESISTLGFRGEALPTISAVSHITLSTHCDSEPTGCRISIDGGKIRGPEPDAFPRGTRIIVKNLFYNTPARRKFLKSPGVEMSQISDIVCHYMMGYPEIAFKFTKSNVKITSSNGSGNLLDAVLAVYGHEVAKNLIPLKEPPSLANSGMSLKGFISPPNQARPSSRYTTTLVNRRVVKTKLLNQAIVRACSAFFPKGKFPVLVLDLRVPPELIDVNVHPQKTEIRFKDERWVFAIIWEAIQMSLSGLKMVSAPVSQSDSQETTEFQPELDTSIETKTIELPSDANASMFTPPPSFKLPDSYKATQTSFSQMSNQSQANNSNYENHVFDLNESSQEVFSTTRPMQQAQGGNAFTPVVKLSNPKILAQLKNTYLLGEDDEGLFIVDQHVAHERVLFDQFVKTYRDKPLTAQPLLFPVPLKLLPSERLIIKEQLNEIKALGFSVQQEEDGLFYVTTIPVSDKKTNDTQSIQNLLSEVLNGWEGRSLAEIKTDLLKTMACKAAVKAGDPLTPSEWTSLLNQLLKTDNPFTCPHGRPIVLRLTTRQIEVGFLRA